MKVFKGKKCKDIFCEWYNGGHCSRYEGCIKTFDKRKLEIAIAILATCIALTILILIEW